MLARYLNMSSKIGSLGFTLLEITLVVLLLAITAVVAMSNMAVNDQYKLDQAAKEIAQAMRYARSQAMSLNAPYGFRQQSVAKRMRVFRLDTSTSPATLEYDVYHPVSKKLYDIQFDNHPTAAVDSITRQADFFGTCNQGHKVYFDGQGIPWCTDPSNIMLDHFQVILELKGHTRVVTLEGRTGRVSL